MLSQSRNTLQGATRRQFTTRVIFKTIKLTLLKCTMSNSIQPQGKESTQLTRMVMRKDTMNKPMSMEVVEVERQDSILHQFLVINQGDGQVDRICQPPIMLTTITASR